MHATEFSVEEKINLAIFIPFLGALLGAIIGASVSLIVSVRNQKTSLYEAVFEKKFEAANKLIIEAEYLRRGLTEFTRQTDIEKPLFKERWEGQTARELNFFANQSEWILGSEVKEAALAVEKACKESMNSIPDSYDGSVTKAYQHLQAAVHKQTHLPELDKIFKSRIV